MWLLGHFRCHAISAAFKNLLSLFDQFSMKKIVHLQYFVPPYGNAPYRLHEAMLENGLESAMLVYNTPRPAGERFFRYGGLRRMAKLQAYGFLHGVIRRKIRKNKNLFSFPFLVGTDVSRHPAVVAADVIYLHWINGGFLSLRNLKQLAALGKPIVVFMHDMWAITGGCHHSFECEGYKSKCEYCPMYGGQARSSYASFEFKKKKSLFAQFDNFYFVAPSEWLAECARGAAITSGNPISCIPNIVNESVFKPFDKIVAKRILNISADVKTISFGCVAGVNNPIKGWDYFRQALVKVHSEQPDLKLQILIFGSEKEGGVEESIPYPVRFLGQVNDETSMVVLDNATDLFVSPSLAESFGMTAMENIRCGTPVVIFKVGGSVDFVEHKVNGYLASYCSMEDLAEGIVYCLKNKLPNVLDEKFQSHQIIQQHKMLISEMIQS